MQSRSKHIQKFLFMSAFILRYFYYNTGVGDETQIAVVESLQCI